MPSDLTAEYHPYVHVNGLYEHPLADLIHEDLDLAAVLVYEARVAEAHYEGVSTFPKKPRAQLQAAVEDARAVAVQDVDREDEDALCASIATRRTACLRLAEALNLALSFKGFPKPRRQYAVSSGEHLTQLARKVTGAGDKPLHYYHVNRLDSGLRSQLGGSGWSSWSAEELLAKPVIRDDSDNE